MKPGEKIEIDGTTWKCHSASASRLVLVIEHGLKSWREGELLSQEKAAELLGISKSLLGLIETGKREMTPAVLQRFTDLAEGGNY